jgi:TrpR-related protein YerC/YecD
MSLGSKTEQRHVRELCEALHGLTTPDEVRRFLLDLCTPAEMVAMADRWRVAKLLARGIPYRKIYERTGVSTATVTRVARSLDRGEGGYTIALERQGWTSPSGREEDSE